MILSYETEMKPVGYAAYLQCVEKLRLMAGIQVKKPQSIREAMRDSALDDFIQEAVHCRLMDGWPLREQQAFLESLTGMAEMEKRVAIHELAYSLYKTYQCAVSS